MLHQVAYAALVGLVIQRCVVKLRRAENQRYRRLFWFGLLSYGTGFLLWNIDNLACTQLRGWRARLAAGPVPWLSPLLQLHAWWHLLTAYGEQQPRPSAAARRASSRPHA